MPSSITSRGKTFFAPQTVVDVRNELVNPGALGKSVAIFGDFPQLEQYKVHTFRASGLGVSDLYPGVSRLRNLEYIYKEPFNGAQPATALSIINVSSTVQADADEIGGLASFKSKKFGIEGNSVSFILEDPDTVNGDGGLSASDQYYRLRVKAPGYNGNLEFAVTAGGPDQLEFTYQDDQASVNNCTITVADGTLNISFDAVDQDFTLADYSTNDDLAAAISAVDPRLQCEAINFNFLPSQLDEGIFTLTDNANASVTTQLHAHTAALLSLVNLLESGSDFPLSLTLDDGRYRLLEGDADVAGGYDANKITLSGGAQSAPTAAGYRACFQRVDILNKDFTSCMVEATDATTHGYFKTYLDESASYQKERNGFVPCPVNQTLSSLFSLYSRPLGSSRVSVVIQGARYKDYQGNVTSGANDLAVADMAFFMMCMQGSLGIAVPLTGKLPRIEDTVEIYDRDSIQDKNLVAKYSLLGVALDSNNSLVVIRGLTSWRKDNLTQNCEISGLESVDASSRDLRAYVTAELGTQVTNGSAAKLKNLVSKRLAFQRSSGIIKEFANISVSIVDDTAFVDYEIAIVAPLNFIKVSAVIGDGQ